MNTKDREKGGHTKTGQFQSENARVNSQGEKDAEPTQRHESRVSPEKDHVPGHLGYNRSNLNNVNPTRREP